MILEALRITAAWLQDGTNGVNALIDGLTQDGGDSDPPDVTVLEESTSPVAARRHLDVNTSVPVLMVVLARAVGSEGYVTTNYLSGSVTVGILYATRNADSDEGTEDALYTLRAVQQSINLLMKPANVASRTRNNVVLTHTSRMEILPVENDREDAVITHGLFVTYEARDTEPYG